VSVAVGFIERGRRPGMIESRFSFGPGFSSSCKRIRPLEETQHRLYLSIRERFSLNDAASSSPWRSRTRT